MSARRPRLLPTLVLAVLALLPGASRGEWRLWPDYAERPQLDQQQTDGEGRVAVVDRPGSAAGQTFQPSAWRLHRIDVRVKNRGDPRPARLRLWRWRGSRERTLAADPHFEDWIEMAGHRNWRTRSVFPDLSVEPGALYYFQLEGPGRGRFDVGTSSKGEDRYPSGQAYAGSKPGGASRDLWFRTWAPDGGDPPERARSSGPVRWSPPPAQEGTVGRSDYLERIAGHAEQLRRPRSDCGRLDHQHAFYDAFLYSLSCEAGRCDEALARSAIARLERAVRWFRCELPADAPRRCQARCEPGKDARSYTLITAAPAYRWLHDSPSWRPQSRARARDYLAEVGTAYWPKRELGTSNRAFRAAASYLHLAAIRPEHPDAKAWRSYGLRVWRDFREHVDFEMDSASYQAKNLWPGLLALAEVSGEADALWADARFRALVDRVFQQTAPMGVLPGYGDASGWAYSSPGLVWLFEEAARRTGEGRYRWLARQIYAYSQRHTRAAPPQRDAWEPKLYDLAYAYRTAWNGAAEPPAPLRPERLAAQNREESRWRVAVGGRVGQRFAHPGGALVRLDLGARTGGALPRVRIWPWRGDPDATRAARPLYSAAAVRSTPETLSAFPVIPGDAPGDYYVELEAADAVLEVAGSVGDAYPEGRAFGVPGAAQADLRFELQVLRGYGSALTHREESAEQPLEAWGTPRRVFDFTGRRVPDKLVLRSGPRPEDLFVLVNLLNGYNHGQANLGAVSVVLDGGSVVLGETSFPYFEHALRPEEENIALVRRYAGGTPQEPGRSVEVPRFVDTRNLSVAWLRFRDALGWGVAQERRFLFAKNRLLWIRDRFDLPAGMRAAVGAVWHPAHVEAPASPGAGHRIAYPHPLRNVWPYHNPARFARLWMPAAPDTAQALERMPEHVPTPGCEQKAAGAGPVPGKCRFSSYYALHRSWSGDSGDGRSVWIDTVLVPEGPDETSTLRVLHSQGAARVIELRVRGERWLLLDNPERRSLDAGGARTDALYAVVKASAPGAPYLHVAEATAFEGFGIELSSEAPSTTERGAFDPARP